MFLHGCSISFSWHSGNPYISYILFLFLKERRFLFWRIWRKQCYFPTDKLFLGIRLQRARRKPNNQMFKQQFFLVSCLTFGELRPCSENTGGLPVGLVNNEALETQAFLAVPITVRNALARWASVYWSGSVTCQLWQQLHEKATKSFLFDLSTVVRDKCVKTVCFILTQSDVMHFKVLWGLYRISNVFSG